MNISNDKFEDATRHLSGASAMALIMESADFHDFNDEAKTNYSYVLATLIDRARKALSEGCE